jgi:hypothetical protein
MGLLKYTRYIKDMKSEGIPSAVTDEYKRGWYDGYQEGLKLKPPTTVIPTTPFPYRNAAGQSCIVCGIPFQIAMDYVCSNFSCPNKLSVTCSSDTTAIKNSTLNSMADNNMTMLKADMFGTIKSEDLK